MVLRQLGEPDVNAIAELYAAVEAVDDEGEHLSAQDVREELAGPGIECTGVFDGDALVGHGLFVVRDRGRQAYMAGRTHPDRRGEGIGSLVTAALMDRARDLRVEAGAPVKLLAGAKSGNAAADGLLREFGFEPERWGISMDAELAGVGPVPAPPTGYTVRTFTGADSEPLREVHNIVFRDHPNSTTWPVDQWRTGIESSSFRPALTFLAEAGGDIVAYVMTYEYDAHAAITGRRQAYFARVGTVRAHRGRGVAAWLMAQTLATCAAAGFDTAALDVDADNPTGALRVYERAGFTAGRRFTYYRQDLD